MKYCSHCGNELVDDAVICPKCGCPTDNYGGNNPTYGSQTNNNNSLSTLAIVGFIFAFIQSLVGLICSIIAYKNASAEGNEKCKSFAKTGIILSAVFLGLEVLFIVLWSVLIAVGLIGAINYYPDIIY